jgi:Tol biopolymer transport system component
MPSPFQRSSRELLPGQRSELTLIHADGSGREVIFAADDAIVESPNWHPDGETIVFNAGGELWRIGVDGSGLARIATGAVGGINNDHVISPDGRTIYVSSEDGHIYALPAAGGEPRRVSNLHKTMFHYYLHGVSPDGASLSYVAVEGLDPRRINIFTIPAAGGPDTRLTDTDDQVDGGEFSPDGRWLYFNAERGAHHPGHAQCYRMRPDGRGVEQLTHDERVNWFPHPAPDFSTVVYISYPPGTRAHPANVDVALKTMTPDGRNHREIVSLFGGQGTLNVNAWAPDSRRFAYVAYPVFN